ncbi:MAG TPA: AmmeMemoRadiSam system protein A [Thermodesulfobacteriaceae bacterium]|nr:AmmeMemoRadiSam system protein A [Thermodesulfobacteriaceae bacterium]
MEKENLTEQERRFLLNLAGSAIESELEGRPFTLPMVTNSRLLEHQGAFVTIHIRGRLRGCIGTFTADKPLYETIADMALSAAFRDPRFPPLTPSEFKDIDIEISVLSPMKLISEINEIEIGTHGIYIVNGPWRGVLLPQVATEHGWDQTTFLDQTCIKAGLAPGCWKDPETRIYIFSAEIFH